MLLSGIVRAAALTACLLRTGFAVDAAAAGSSRCTDGGRHDADGVCALRPASPANALGEDVRADTGAAVELLQRSLWYRSPERRNVGALAAEVAAAAVSTPSVGPCDALSGEDVAWAPPLPTSFRTEIELFRFFGFISKRGHRCLFPQSNTSGLSLMSAPAADADLYARNKLANIISVCFFALAVLVVLWSVASVMSVPKKQPWEDKNPKMMDLANEENAYNAGLFSWLSLGWADDLVGRYGKCVAAVANDQDLGLKRGESEFDAYRTLKTHWQEQVKLKGVEHAWLTIAVYKTIGSRAMARIALMTFIELFFALVALVLALAWFLSYLEKMADEYAVNPDAQMDYLKPSVTVLGMLFGIPAIYRGASIAVALMDGYYCNICSAGLSAMVFEKALRLPLGEHAHVSEDETGGPGKPLNTQQTETSAKPNVVQILNVDIIEMWTTLLKTVWTVMFCPLITIILFAWLIKELSFAGVLGFLYIVPCTVCSTAVQLTCMHFWKRYQSCQDVRLKSLTEVVLHIRTIKSLAWETLSYDRLHAARMAELKFAQLQTMAGGTTLALLHTMPWCSMLIALGMTLKTRGEIRASQIIVVQRLMMSLLVAVGVMILSIRKVGQAPNSFRRVRAYLAQPEAPEGVVRPICKHAEDDAPIAVRAKGSFTYVDSTPPSIQNLDVAVLKGELVGVIGEVASGKSSFLHTLLGELFPVNGAVVEGPGGDGRTAFCAQVPWIYEGTLKENVLLRAPFDAERYRQALYSAALLPDLKVLPGGDLVTIGSNGVRLSGGQRARVSLARAAYGHSELVLIDDPFASVDVPTGQHLLNELLLGELMRGRTRIVVTQPSIRLRKFDRVLLMKDGAVVECGTPAEVMASTAYQRLLARESETHLDLLDTALAPIGDYTPADEDRRLPENATANQLRDAEGQEYISWESFKWWMGAAGWGNLTFFITVVVLQRFMTLMSNLTLAVWMDAKTTPHKEFNDQHYMARTATYVFLFFCFVIVGTYASSRVAMSASTATHKSVIYAMLRAPIDRFFDKTPVGRLINRLSYDMKQVDDSIGVTGTAMVTFVLGVIVTQGFILSVMPAKVVLVTTPFYAAILLFMYLYRGTSVPLVFHTKFCLSVLQDMQAMALNTGVSVRANSMFDEFILRYNQQCGVIVRCQYLCSYVCRAWVQSRVFLCLCVLTCLFALGGLHSRMPMGTLATCISLSFEQMVEFENICVVFTQYLNVLNALQRLTNYFRIPQEAAPQMPGDPVVRLRTRIDRVAGSHFEIRRGPEAEACLHGNKGGGFVVYHNGVPVIKASEDGSCLEALEGKSLKHVFPSCQALQDSPAEYSIVAVNSTAKDATEMAAELCNPLATTWLDLWHKSYTGGMRIVLDGMTAGYGRDPDVLHDVHVSIPERCKVGFAGKTGCGKSTTLLCILRILELRKGRIMLGDLDTARIGLNTLRNLVGLVPQDPTVFEGTWRFNIDPFNEFPEGRIWEALHSVQLLPYIRTLAKGIDTEIKRDGGNISFGQRQLLSLARMVIRQPPVLLLDECTSALDPNTQQIVQSTLLNEFPMSSIVAIAHRVETILDFDRIVVFDKGTVAEQGTLKEVMGIQNGIFRRMVEGTKGINQRAEE